MKPQEKTLNYLSNPSVGYYDQPGVKTQILAWKKKFLDFNGEQVELLKKCVFLFRGFFVVVLNWILNEGQIQFIRINLRFCH